MKFNDPTGHCATLKDGSPNWEGEVNYQCWQTAYAIYGYGAAGLAAFQQDWKVTADDWLENIAKQEFATTEYLQPFHKKYYSLWKASVGLSHYTPNEGPPAPSFTVNFETEYLNPLTACANTVNGACGVSAGVTGSYGAGGASIGVTGRGSIDFLVDQHGNRIYLWTVGAGPQAAILPVAEFSRSSVYIAAPGASVYDFTGFGVSAGGSVAVGTGVSVDLVGNLADGGSILGVAGGVAGGYNAEVHFMLTYSGVLYDPQAR